MDESDESAIDNPKYLPKQVLVSRGSSQRSSTSSVLQFRTSDSGSNNSETLSQNSVSYQFVPIKVESSSIDSLADSDSAMPIRPISPILAPQIAPNQPESRLALIAPSDSTVSANPTVLVSGGIAYIISEPTTVSSGGRTSTLSRTTDSIMSLRVGPSKDEKRRVTHNEVERRRRDKINNWICRLAKILPECPDMHAKNNTQVSKGMILSKACDHIDELKKEIRSLSDKLALAELNKSASQARQEMEMLKRENERLKSDNAALKSLLQQNGLIANT